MTDDTTPIPTTPLARFDEALPNHERALPPPDGIDESAELLRVWVNGRGDVQVMAAAPNEGDVEHPARAQLWGEVLAATIQIMANTTVPEADRKKWTGSVLIALQERLEGRP